MRDILGHYNGGSYQSRGVILKPIYKNNADFKRGKIVIEVEYSALWERIKNSEDLSSEEKERFNHLDKIRCALNLTTETENYVPEILERMSVFKKMMDAPSSLILGAELDTTDVSDITGADK